MTKARAEAQRMLRFQTSALESLGKRPGAERVFQEGDRYFRETMSGKLNRKYLVDPRDFLQRTPASRSRNTKLYKKWGVTSGLSSIGIA